MKIDRLIGILTILLQNEKTTAPKLAKRFEVSRRTINRDNEDICKAGIPIVTTQGINGGISIMDNYKIDKTLLSYEELRSILTGLLSLDSVSQSKKYKQLIDKFTTDKDSLLLRNNILIDLSSHYKESLAPKIELLQLSINHNKKITFHYHNKNGNHSVLADPYLIIFQWSSWYMLGIDNATDQFKLYKLNRISSMESTNKEYYPREIPPDKLDFGSYLTDDIKTVILFDKSEEYRLIEDYGIGCYEETSEGKLLFSFPFTNEDYLLSWVLSFGDKAELIKPIELRLLLKKRLTNTLQKYL